MKRLLLCLLLMSCQRENEHKKLPKGVPSYVSDPESWKGFKDGDGFSTSIPKGLEVKLYFKSLEEIHKGEGKYTYAYTVLPKDTKDGVCEITLPTDTKVEGRLGDVTIGDEDFKNPYYQKAFAHELLHCLVGDFHPKKG